jgi:hypothetical protein
MSFIGRAWHGYLGLLERHPLKTKCITSGCIMAAGDFIQQGIEYRTRVAKQTQKTGTFICRYDWGRSFRSGIFGAFAVGPVFHYWFRFLDRAIPGTSTRAVAGKLLLDQGVMAPVFTVFYFVAMGMLERRDSVYIVKKIETAAWPTLLANYAIFPAAQAANFMFVPLKLRVLVLNA